MNESLVRFTLSPIPPPKTFSNVKSTVISDEVMAHRLQKILTAMQQHNFDVLVIYADKEHGGNFEYLSGFIPRFEEALLVVTAQGKLTYIMGNENLKLVPHARNPGACLHAPAFSLPNQPMDNDAPLATLLAKAGVTRASKTGIAGWKLFTSQQQNNAYRFDIPAFILDEVIDAAGDRQHVTNATGLFISPDYGVRCLNSASEIACYEYGANLASTHILRALDTLEVGKSEKEIGQL